MARRKTDYDALWADSKRKEYSGKILRMGGTMEDVAKYLGGCRASFEAWLKNNIDARDFLQRAKAGAVEEIHDTLFKLAKGGFTVTKKKVTVIENPDGSTTTKTETATETVPPNQRAVEVYLRNASDAYRDNDYFTQRTKAKELEIKETKANTEEW